MSLLVCQEWFDQTEREVKQGIGGLMTRSSLKIFINFQVKSKCNPFQSSFFVWDAVPLSPTCPREVKDNEKGMELLMELFFAETDENRILSIS